MPTDFEEALTAAGASALIQKQIDPVLLEYQRRYSPFIRACPTVRWGSNVYYFNQRTQLVPGGFVTDGGARPVGTSTYVQNFYPIKLLQSVGAVTGFSQQVTADLIGDLRAREIRGAAQGLLWDIEVGMDWGNAAATANGPWPQFDGLDTLVSDFTSASKNSINEAGGNFSLGTMDNLIDLVESNVAEPVTDDSWMFVMSSTAQSRVAQLLTNQQRFNDQVEVEAGLVVPTYRNVPIVKSSFLTPRSNVMTAVSTATATSGGSIADSTTYYYRIAPVMSRFGEIQASAEVSRITGSSGSNANTITLSFTVPSGPEGAAPTLWKVYRSTATTTETFLGYVDALVGTQADNITPIYANNIVDTGAALIPQFATGPVVPATLPTAYFGTNTGLLPLNSGAQNIYLLPRNSDYLVRPYVRDMIPVDIYPTTTSPDSLPFAFVSDTTLAIRAPKYLGRAANVNVTLAS